MLIRLAELNDALEIHDIYAPYVENTVISFEYEVPTIDEMEARIRRISQCYPWIVLEDGGRILGYAYASKHRERASYRWSVDVSIYISKGFHSRDIGKALYASLLPVLKQQGYYNAYAGICLPNEKSVGIHEYFGFKKVAHYSKVGYKMGEWHDVGWWELILQDHNKIPDEPRPVTCIEESILREIFSKSIKIN